MTNKMRLFQAVLLMEQVRKEMKQHDNRYDECVFSENENKIIAWQEIMNDLKFQEFMAKKELEEARAPYTSYQLKNLKKEYEKWSLTLV